VAEGHEGGGGLKNNKQNNNKVHSVEMQFYADWKGTVALDDITLWAGRR